MKTPFSIILVLALLLTGLLGLTILTDSAAAETSPPGPTQPDYAIWGVSYTENGSLRLAVDDKAIIAFPIVEWSLYLGADAYVKVVSPNGTIVDADLTAGFYSFSETYPDDVGRVTVTWTIGEAIETFAFAVASGSSHAWELENPNQTITFTKDAHKKKERDLALGCIACALIPSIFLIPYWQRKKDEDFYEAF